MKKIGLIIFGSLLLLISYTASSKNTVPASTVQSLAPMLKKVMPAIVNVSVQGVISSGQLIEDKKNNQPLPTTPKKFSSIGSGVIIDPKKGYIVTNAHVIKQASQITITLFDGRRLQAKLIGDDIATDLAVIQIKADQLPSLKMGDSLTAQVGDFVVAIGNPFGLNSFGNSQTATFGIISALQRNTLNIEGVENFIQTDAAINPGNSGGALVNSKGELIGINTAILAPYGGNVGIGFAIPIDMVKDVVAQLVRYGSVHRGLMGIFVQHLTPEIAQALNLPQSTKGALIAQVNENTPAQKAGLKMGDIITKINNTPITDAAQVKTVISLLRVGSSVRIELIRDKKPMSIHAVVSSMKQHEDSVQQTDPYYYGIALENFYQQLPGHGVINGIQVTGASENSAAWRSGIRPGDIITHVNGNPVTSINDLHAQSKPAKDQSLLLRVIRGPGSLFIILK